MVTGLEVDDVVVRYRTTIPRGGRGRRRDKPGCAGAAGAGAAGAEVTAVDGVSLQIAPGEIVALLGASGSGKSSLLRAVAGLEPLAAGRVLWDGEDLAGVKIHKRGFGLMFQDAQLFSSMNVGRNVGYGLYKMPRAERNRRVDELLDLVGLPGYGSRRSSELSGGQAQRVALARSLATDPRLFLLDEPLSALDANLRQHLVGVLSDVLRRTRTTSMYVTHDQDEAFAIADRVAVMGAGRLLQIGSRDEVWRRPNSMEVARFLGYWPFLGPADAAAIGVREVPEGTLLALAPDALRVDDAGVEVGVLDQQPRKEGVRVRVALPGDHVGSLLLPERLASERVRVAVDADATARVPG